jgi:hypothetical protein
MPDSVNNCSVFGVLILKWTVKREGTFPYDCSGLLQIFAALWGTNELLSSFDSVNVMAPGTSPSRSWLHTDQRPTAQGLTCIQALVNLVDVSEDTTGEPAFCPTCLGE